MNKEQNTETREKQTIVFDVMIAEEGKNGRTYWQTIGVAFPLSNGANGLSMKLNMFPNLRIYIKESIRPVGASKSKLEQTEDPQF